MKPLYHALLGILFITTANCTQANPSTIYCPPASAIHCDGSCTLDEIYKSIWTINSVDGYPSSADKITFLVAVVASTHNSTECEYAYSPSAVIAVESAVSLTPDLSMPNQWVKMSGDDYIYCSKGRVNVEDCPLMKI